MKPRLLRSELTGQVYVVTRYKVDPKSGLIEAQTKYDVTDEFNALLARPMADDEELVLAGALALLDTPEPDWSGVEDHEVPNAAIRAMSRIVLQGVDTHRAVKRDLALARSRRLGAD